MAWFNVEVEVHSYGTLADVECGIRETLEEHRYEPKNVKVQFKPEPMRLKDYPPHMIRKADGNETYRVVIPGLMKGGEEVTVPVWEEDVDLELLANILENEGSWESEA